MKVTQFINLFTFGQLCLFVNPNNDKDAYTMHTPAW